MSPTADDRLNSGTWRSAHGDMSDEEWDLIADLVEPCSVAASVSDNAGGITVID